MCHALAHPRTPVSRSSFGSQVLGPQLSAPLAIKNDREPPVAGFSHRIFIVHFIQSPDLQSPSGIHSAGEHSSFKPRSFALRSPVDSESGLLSRSALGCPRKPHTAPTEPFRNFPRAASDRSSGLRIDGSGVNWRSGPIASISVITPRDSQ